MAWSDHQWAEVESETRRGMEGLAAREFRRALWPIALCYEAASIRDGAYRLGRPFNELGNKQIGALVDQFEKLYRWTSPTRRLKEEKVLARSRIGFVSARQDRLKREWVSLADMLRERSRVLTAQRLNVPHLDVPHLMGALMDRLRKRLQGGHEIRLRRGTKLKGINGHLWTAPSDMHVSFKGDEVFARRGDGFRVLCQCPTCKESMVFTLQIGSRTQQSDTVYGDASHDYPTSLMVVNPRARDSAILKQVKAARACLERADDQPRMGRPPSGSRGHLLTTMHPERRGDRRQFPGRLEDFHDLVEPYYKVLHKRAARLLRAADPNAAQVANIRRLRRNKLLRFWKLVTRPGEEEFWVE